MIHVITWCWGTKYAIGYLDKLSAGVRRHLKQPYRFIVITDDPSQPAITALLGKTVNEVWEIPQEDRYLLKRPGCLTRLRLFDPAWQAGHGVIPGDRIACVDLDAIVTGPLDEVLDRDDTFTILQNVNTSNPCVFNGSLWMLRAGAHAEVWREFSLEAIEKLDFFAFPDDQGWMEHMMPNAGAWGPRDGVFGFCKAGWPAGHALPPGARLVTFPGYRDPVQFTHLDWVQRHWHG